MKNKDCCCESTETWRYAGYKGVSELLESKKSSAVYAALADVLKASTSKRTRKSPGVTADKVRKVSIWQHPKVFENLKKDPAVFDEVQKLAARNRTAYLIVGVLVTGNISYKEHSSSSSTMNLKGRLPIKEASLAAGGPPLGPIDFEVKRDAERTNDAGVELEGERIFAIQYRILRKRLISRSGGMTLTSSTLQGDRTFGDDLGAKGQARQMFDLELDSDTLEDEIDDAEEICFEI
ncbi:hypothetical protein VTL71DRAFT_9542 [Oculimacula yallundae]|uniref:Uncharacterized protein n=1 Tax=Oculimacula yallundae TaxID=86028 RepID=A0ABR4BTT2_9HELO